MIKPWLNHIKSLASSLQSRLCHPLPLNLAEEVPRWSRGWSPSGSNSDGDGFAQLVASQIVPRSGLQIILYGLLGTPVTSSEAKYMAIYMAISLSNGEVSAASFAHLRKHAWPRVGLKGQQNMSATLLAGSLLHTNCTLRAEKAELLSSSNRVWTARPCLLLRLPISSCPGVFFGIQSIVEVHVIWMTWDVVSNAFGDEIKRFRDVHFKFILPSSKLTYTGLIW